MSSIIDQTIRKETNLRKIIAAFIYLSFVFNSTIFSSEAVEDEDKTLEESMKEAIEKLRKKTKEEFFEEQRLKLQNHYYEQLCETFERRQALPCQTGNVELEQVAPSLRVLAQILSESQTSVELVVGMKSMFCHSSDYGHFLSAHICSQCTFNRGELGDIFYLFSYIPSKLQQGDFTEGDWEACLDYLREQHINTLGIGGSSSSGSSSSSNLLPVSGMPTSYYENPLDHNSGHNSSVAPYEIALLDSNKHFPLLKASRKREELRDALYGQYLLELEQERLETYAQLVRIGAKTREIDEKMLLLFNSRAHHKGTLIAQVGARSDQQDHQLAIVIMTYIINKTYILLFVVQQMKKILSEGLSR